MRLIGASPCVMCGCEAVHHVSNLPSLELAFADVVKHRIMCPKCKRSVICEGYACDAISAWNKLNEEKPKESRDHVG